MNEGIHRNVMMSLTYIKPISLSNDKIETIPKSAIITLTIHVVHSKFLFSCNAAAANTLAKKAAKQKKTDKYDINFLDISVTIVKPTFTL